MSKPTTKPRIGRPPIDPAKVKRNLTLRLSPAAIEAAKRLGAARVDELLIEADG